MFILLDGNKTAKTAIRHIDFCSTGGDCSQRAMVNQLFVNLLNHLHELVLTGNEGDIDDNFNCPQLDALRPYLPDPNAGIYNFHKEPFSFSFHKPIENEKEKYDVIIINWSYDSNTAIANIDTSNFSNPDTFFSLEGAITLSNGEKIKEAKARHINFCPDSDSCSQKPQITKLFVNLVNRLHQMVIDGDASQITDGFNCDEMDALRPYITDREALIYNFSEAPFSFSFHPIKDEDPKYDVILDKWDYVENNEITSIDLGSFTSPVTFTVLDFKAITAKGQKIEIARVRHVDFCPGSEGDCPQPQINQLYANLLNHLHEMVMNGNAGQIDENYEFPALTAIRPYVTDGYAKIYNFQEEPMSFSFHPMKEDSKYDVIVDKWPVGTNTEIVNIDLASYDNPANYTNLDFKITLANGYIIEVSKVRHIDFCPGQVNYCIANNPKAATVRQLFLALVNYLHQYSENNTISEGYTCSALTALAPFITDKDPAIYAFELSDEGMQFSFHKPGEGEKHDVKLFPWATGSGTNAVSVDLSGYNSPDFYTQLGGDVMLENGSKINKGEVRHINFCPDDLCVNHIALVIDESSSLDNDEKNKIRRQLAAFVEQQAIDNGTTGNMHLSLIGMADSDDFERPDNVNVLEKKIDATTLPDFLEWIANYGNRYGDPGVSKGSDYWKSGLKVALACARKPDMVIMITDGCQTANAGSLKETMMGFENYYGNEGTSKPHLYVIGIDNGFYVYDNALYDNGGQRLSGNSSPNDFPSLENTSTFVTAEGNVTANLSLSLKYLLNYPGSQFPESSLTNFNADYFPHVDFKFIGNRDNKDYLSDKLVLADIGCGNLSDPGPCKECFSFQPAPGSSYILSAWVKEEHAVQVQEYPNPKILVKFLGNQDFPLGEAVGLAGGPIIEGWQRLVKRIDVPNDTQFIEFQLINQSQQLPVFFDDIRIYPIKGSMKSFVYDPENFKLMSELDDNNFATYYEYDQEGGLVRIKKETSEGVKTIQETRSGNYLKE
jgi:hypothetical protein